MGNRFYLNDSDRAILKELIGWFKSTRLNPDADQLQDPATGPDVYLVKADGIPARSGTTPGSTACDIWTVTGVDSLGIQELEESEGTPFTQVVVNPMAITVSSHADEPNTLAIRAKSGHFIGVPLPNDQQVCITAVRLDLTTDKWQFKSRTLLGIWLDEESTWQDMAQFEECVTA